MTNKKYLYIFLKYKMTPTDYIWVFIFSTLFVVFNILLFCIIDYIDNKPPGYQTIYDLVLRDTFIMMRITGICFSLIPIFSRFDYFCQLAINYKIILLFACCIYTFTFVATGIHASCMSLLRSVSLLNMTLVEDAGEIKVRRGIGVFSICMSSCSCYIQTITGDIYSGTPFTLLTKEIRLTGSARSIINGFVYVSLIFTFCTMTTIMKCFSRKLYRASMSISGNENFNSRTDYCLSLVSVLVLMIFGSQLYIDFHSELKSETYYLFKDSSTMSILLVFFPIVILVNNENMGNHFMNLFRPLWDSETKISIKSIFHKNVVAAS